MLEIFLNQSLCLTYPREENQKKGGGKVKYQDFNNPVLVRVNELREKKGGGGGG